MSGRNSRQEEALPTSEPNTILSLLDGIRRTRLTSDSRRKSINKFRASSTSIYITGIFPVTSITKSDTARFHYSYEIVTIMTKLVG